MVQIGTQLVGGIVHQIVQVDASIGIGVADLERPRADGVNDNDRHHIADLRLVRMDVVNGTGQSQLLSGEGDEAQTVSQLQVPRVLGHLDRPGDLQYRSDPGRVVYEPFAQHRVIMRPDDQILRGHGTMMECRL